MSRHLPPSISDSDFNALLNVSASSPEEKAGCDVVVAIARALIDDGKEKEDDGTGL